MPAENYDEMNARLKVLEGVTDYLMEQWRQKVNVEQVCAEREARNPKLPSAPTPARILKLAREMWGFVGFDQAPPPAPGSRTLHDDIDGEE